MSFVHNVEKVSQLSHINCEWGANTALISVSETASGVRPAHSALWSGENI